MKKDGGRRHVFFGYVLINVGGLFGCFAAASQMVASHFAYQRALGAPLVAIGKVGIYYPWKWPFWSLKFHEYAPAVFDRALWLTVGGIVLTVLASFGLAILRVRNQHTSDAHGSSRWGTLEDVKRAGLGATDGVVLAQSNDAVYEAEPGDNGVRWKMKKPGKMLLRQDGA